MNHQSPFPPCPDLPRHRYVIYRAWRDNSPILKLWRFRLFNLGCRGGGGAGGRVGVELRGGVGSHNKCTGRSVLHAEPHFEDNQIPLSNAGASPVGCNSAGVIIVGIVLHPQGFGWGGRRARLAKCGLRNKHAELQFIGLGTPKVQNVAPGAGVGSH
jgi:hypothetical protein